MSIPPVYIINFEATARKERMLQRFRALGIEPFFVPPVYKSDPRLERPDAARLEKRTCSIMLQHLDSLQHFLDHHPDQEYCIVCEDDILISKNLAQDMSQIVANTKARELDILLLGYLLPDRIQVHPQQYPHHGYSYHQYDHNLWGSQMYMVSQSYARFLVNTFTVDQAIRTQETPPFNPDWIITKNGNRAMIYPMLAVEEGETKTDHEGQNSFHRQCFAANYDPQVHR